MTLRTANALVQTVVDLVETGTLAPGQRMPTVREVAETCGMSRSAVGEAWRELGARGMIETHRRGGTRVLGKPAIPRALRYESMIRSTITAPRDLANIRTDDLPYPDLARALASSIAQPRLNVPFAEPITEELEHAVRAAWPFNPDGLLTVHGLMDGIELALSTLVKPGDAVIVESPSPGRVFDVLEAMGARVIPVAYGPGGPDLDALRRALISKPAVFVYQPTRQIPSGRSVTSEWTRAAADILPDNLPVLEFSQLSLLKADQASLGRLHDRVIQVQSFNLFFGSDLRVSVIGGDAALIDAMWLKLTFSTRFVSRIVQGALAFLLTDSEALRQLELFLASLRERHRLLLDALRLQNLDVEDSAGPNVWLTVPDDHSVSTQLSHQGIAIHPGRLFQASPAREERILMNSAAVNGDHAEVAAMIAAACRPLTAR